MFLLFSALWLSTGSAFAHETRDVAGGKYQFRVGFIAEPAYQGLENGLELTVCTGQCTTKADTNGVLSNGLTGAFDTLKAEVIFGPNTMPLTLVAVPYNPGKYDANFVPTRTGTYTFHITGTLGTDKIDERFTSSPDTFDSVQPLTAVQFPDKTGYNQGAVSVPAATPQNSGGQSVAGLTVAAPPSQAATTPDSGATPAAAIAPASSPATQVGASASDLQDLKQQLATQQQALDTAKNNASSAGTLGLVGLIVGIIGIVLAGAALFMNRSKGNSGPTKPRREIEGG